MFREERIGIFNEIEDERYHQVQKWGNSFDDTHSPADWWTILTLNFPRALPSWRLNKNDPNGHDRSKLRAGLVKVAAIVVAWIEAIDRS